MSSGGQISQNLPAWSRFAQSRSQAQPQQTFDPLDPNYGQQQQIYPSGGGEPIRTSQLGAGTGIPSPNTQPMPMPQAQPQQQMGGWGSVMRSPYAPKQMQSQQGWGQMGGMPMMQAFRNYGLFGMQPPQQQFQPRQQWQPSQQMMQAYQPQQFQQMQQPYQQFQQQAQGLASLQQGLGGLGQGFSGGYGGYPQSMGSFRQMY